MYDVVSCVLYCVFFVIVFVFLWYVLCVFIVSVCFRCDSTCDAARFEFVCVCEWYCVFVCVVLFMCVVFVRY